MARIRIRTPAELRRIARTQVGSEIGSEVAPYEEESRAATRRRERVQSDLGRLYGGLQSEAVASAGRVKGYADQSQQAQRDIFQKYAQQLSSLQQDRATEAQQMAQTIGGPVPVSEFEAGTSAQAKAAPALAAGAMLESAGLANAEVSQAETFAGQVLPLIRSEEENRNITAFEDKISDINAEISRIKKTRGGRETTRYNELLTQEREAQLQDLTYSLEKLKADRDWKLSKQSLSQAQQELELKGDEMDIHRDELREQGRQFDISTEIERSKIARDDKTNSDTMRAAELIDSMTTGGEPHDSVRAVENFVGDFDPSSDEIPSGVYVQLNENGKPVKGSKPGTYRYVRLSKVTETLPAFDPITDPQQVYQRLIFLGIPRNIARRKVIEAFYLNSKWKPRAPGVQKPPPKPKGKPSKGGKKGRGNS